MEKYYIKVQDSSPKNYWEGNCSYIYLSTKTKTNVSHVVIGLLQTDRPVTLSSGLNLNWKKKLEARENSSFYKYTTMYLDPTTFFNVTYI